MRYATAGLQPCGDLIMRCPSCDTPNPPEAVRCEECGAKMPVKKRPAARVEEEEEEEEDPRPRRKSAESSRARRRPVDDDDDDDEDYERPRRRRRHEEDEDEDDDEVIKTIIPVRNPMALASYYLCFVALLPALGVLVALVSIVLGILGIAESKRNRKAKGSAHAIIGIYVSLISVPLNIVACYYLYDIYLK
jgi:hypothetical protein